MTDDSGSGRMPFGKAVLKAIQYLRHNIPKKVLSRDVEVNALLMDSYNSGYKDAVHDAFFVVRGYLLDPDGWGPWICMFCGRNTRYDGGTATKDGKPCCVKCLKEA
jgi:hypothetical protein